MRLPAQLAILLPAVLAGTVVLADTQPAAKTQHPPVHKRHAAVRKPAPEPEPVPPPAPAFKAPVSLLEQPPVPAQIQLAGNKLSVRAENASLNATLHDISSKTGMIIDGLSSDQRIFGNYGPGSPREVVSALLDGLGYNILMVGMQANGAPRQLLLTPRTAAIAAKNLPAPAMRPGNNDDDDDAADPQQDTIQVPQQPEPNENQPQQPAAPPGQNGNNPGAVRTPQQMLQELQDMRNRQLQQQQQAPQQQP